MLKPETLAFIRKNLKEKKIGLLGDLCVDIYWHADMRRSELSRETPHFPLPVYEERVSLGAGGNVAANLAALGPKSVQALSLFGDDWRGGLLKDRAKALGIDTSLFIETPGRFTNAYCKPIRHGISDTVYEDPRLDFENRTPISEETQATVLERLESLAQNVDVLCVADQFACGIVTPAAREAVCALAKKGLPVIADSRYHIGDYKYCILKPNELECWRALHGETAAQPDNTEQIKAAAAALAKRNAARVFCTLGANGAFVTDGASGEDIPAVQLTSPLDICGAGDTSLAAFACAVACGTTLPDAARFAAVASAVTVQKLGETGTASFYEIESLLS